METEEIVELVENKRKSSALQQHQRDSARLSSAPKVVTGGSGSNLD